jgi:hypothetical protein
LRREKVLERQRGPHTREDGDEEDDPDADDEGRKRRRA